MMYVSNVVNMDAPLFADDDDKTSAKPKEDSSWKVLVVDDEEDMLAVTRLVFSSFRFENRPVKLLTAASARKALEVLADHKDIAVAFIDVVMETDQAGLDLVRDIRGVLGNDEIQLILRTGQPGYAPEMKVILEYGINDYRTKTELDNVKLISCLVAGLRNYKNIVGARQAASREAVESQLHQAKSLFFAQMSHDLRTPLNSILGFCQLLELSKLDAEQSEQVKLIGDSGKHLLALVNDILDLSKGEAGKIQLEVIPFSLHELVQDTAKFLLPQAHSGVAFECDLDARVADRVLGDPVRVRQILYNLLSNALKFTQHGFVKLLVEPETGGEQGAQSGDRVRFTVTDTGPGIPANRLQSLFSIYEQADVSVSRSHGGTGLGLSICKQLAELMEGSVNVSSQVGKGSTFQVILKLPLIEFPPSAVKPVPRGQKIFYARILVVDDDRVNRMVLQKMLERRGLGVVCAESGAQALSAARSGKFDMILMDCQMPEMSGTEATQRIRKLQGYSKVPIVALTGNGDGDMAACFNAGMNDFMQKPVDMDALGEMVSKWLGFRSMME